ncbi:SDR family oxidoreductase [Haloactinomyces albus]|uniref:NAD(P)-dependent dehydrogenase (Short-subunit alcohol dehydrogenase family) n=1 Tax=Haloactinomyces albus TaxID=1352928 RepID=A0AAE4CMW1_9ACTN|nr:SDR family oxidoreductase [Haloactinomyces albus]MDR7300028.1 NAD(P)-dependent dehydrogenase (short-subunit alcohol dehydrogenase family) [Haloactinomyces albus]
MAQRIAGSVAVITGASSGIGRAAALAFAERGASVVLAARSADSLHEVARECEKCGGRALAVRTDVTDDTAVRALAGQAKEAFGRIDVWVNGAAVIVYGEFEDVPLEVYRRVLETNLFGQIHGARAVLPHFREQGSGRLINISSVWGSITAPYVSAYVVSKFGIRAFSESLQEGLRLRPEARDIHVCTILPQSVDTPIFRHAGRYTARSPKPVPLIVDPSRVVRAILRSVEHPRRQRIVGWWGRLLEVGHTVAPGFYSRLVPGVMNRTAFTRRPTAPGPGNIFEPMPEWNRVSGDWRYGRAKLATGTAAITAAAAAVIAAARRRSAD